MLQSAAKEISGNLKELCIFRPDKETRDLHTLLTNE
jgi:hypothetical protein